MKILKQLAVAAVASAVLLTGCQNSFTGTTRDTSVLASINASTATAGFTVTSASGTLGTLVNTKDQEIAIAFSEPVDQSTIVNAVTVRNLSGTSPTTVYTQGVVIPTTLKYVSGNTAYLALDCSGASGILEVFVDSTKITARNGVLKMDADLDNVKGETIDDDYYLYQTVGTYLTNTAPTTVQGLIRNPRYKMGMTPGGFSTVGATATSTNTYTVNYGNAVAFNDTYDYTSMFNSAVVIEKYVPSANAVGSWTTVSGTGAYVNTTGVYTVTFSSSEGDVLRARVTGIANVKTTGSYYGFQQKASTDNRYTQLQYTGPFKAVLTTAANAKEITAADQRLALIPTAEFDGNGLNGKVLLTVNLAYTGDKGIDLTTLTSSNVKIVDANGNAIAWTGYTTANTNPAYPTIPTQIFLTLDPTYQKQLATNSYTVYVNSGLKTVAGSTVTAIVLNNSARYFGNTGNVDTLPSLIGSLALNTVPLSF